MTRMDLDFILSMYIVYLMCTLEIFIIIRCCCYWCWLFHLLRYQFAFLFIWTWFLSPILYSDGVSRGDKKREWERERDRGWILNRLCDVFFFFYHFKSSYSNFTICILHFLQCWRCEVFPSQKFSMSLSMKINSRWESES